MDVLRLAVLAQDWLPGRGGGRSRIRAEDLMARRLVDTVSGIGSVHAGGLTLRATRYNLSFWIDDDAPVQSDAGKPAIVDGQIDITGIGEAAALSGVDRLTLTLADGREIAFRLKNTSGQIIGL